MPRCRRCGAEFKWIALQNGKPAMVNPTPLRPSEIVGDKIVVSTSGVRCRAENAGVYERDTRVHWFESHYNTCTGRKR